MCPYTKQDSRVKEIIEAAGAVLIYAAPYSPDQMPIEYMYAFNQYKAYLRRHLGLHRRQVQDFATAHVLALSNVSREDMLG